MDIIKVMIVTQDLSEIDKDPGLAARTAQLIQHFGKGRMQAALVYMRNRPDETVFTKDGIICYPVSTKMCLHTVWEEWESTKHDLLKAIEDFKPNVIHCFGSEWIFGAVVRDVSIPVVIHMMGFLTAYFTALDMINRTVPSTARAKPKLAVRVLRRIKRELCGEKRQKAGEIKRTTDIIAGIEQDIMKMNRFFMGRSEWDRNIVRWYSPGARYWHIPEAVKPAVYAAAGQWIYTFDEKLRLLTVSSADDRKGNEIILRTAKLLRDLLHLDFIWRVTGDAGSFARYEQLTDIRCSDVNVELIGSIDNDRIISELKNADLFIHPSVIDNSPHAVCEAQLIGCPVIASNVGGLPALVEDGVTGFLFPYNEPHTLAFLIGNSYRSAETLIRISRNACKTALERHDPAHIAEMLYTAYRNMMTDDEKR